MDGIKFAQALAGDNYFFGAGNLNEIPLLLQKDPKFNKNNPTRWQHPLF